MVAVSAPASSVSPPAVPIRRIGPADIRIALSLGWGDFRAMRGDILFVALIYPLVGLVTAFLALDGLPLHLFFPLAAGLSLMGPLVAVGFYELARRREAGLERGWSHFFDPLRSASMGSLLGIAIGMIMLFGSWIYFAGAIHDAFMTNVPPPSVGAFLTRLFGTEQGWEMMIVGNLVGLAYAIVTLALTWVAMPMLVDRPTDSWTAISTSLRAMAVNPAMAARWGLTVAVLLMLGSIPAFVGLAVMLPWLGYATWHLYTRVVDREAWARS
ncbi:DUF2189 domain-containing protein [Sphingomonas sp. CGMCC 1.13654]|uniref:DUF2189 domain-containing protein n=1 Tax=Sphingomonas chungangi TaxID=2683589 RepID=A0A838LAR3_9SPHN|nr:DUF2189 domain-containing protein [Sphingomonas chungangi]MBA2936294.1 DUF2189 domain-containing protein [Sphingomonas chungangi]MVW55679.1 DUF2189 domain-containing protein [Sphingomonas chungangi]